MKIKSTFYMCADRLSKFWIDSSASEIVISRKQPTYICNVLYSEYLGRFFSASREGRTQEKINHGPWNSTFNNAMLWELLFFILLAPLFDPMLSLGPKSSSRNTKTERTVMEKKRVRRVMTHGMMCKGKGQIIYYGGRILGRNWTKVWSHLY